MVQNQLENFSFQVKGNFLLFLPVYFIILLRRNLINKPKHLASRAPPQGSIPYELGVMMIAPNSLLRQ